MLRLLRDSTNLLQNIRVDPCNNGLKNFGRDRSLQPLNRLRQHILGRDGGDGVAGCEGALSLSVGQNVLFGFTFRLWLEHARLFQEAFFQGIQMVGRSALGREHGMRIDAGVEGAVGQCMQVGGGCASRRERNENLERRR